VLQLAQVGRQEGEEDQIRWGWTTDGMYSTSSAYNIQFASTFSKLNFSPIWKAKAEPKGKFFAWTLLHKRILTADTLQKRGWRCNPCCSLCHNALETPSHLCKDYVFSKQVWTVLLTWGGFAQLNNVQIQGSIYKWWKIQRNKIQKDQRRRFDGRCVFYWWNLWVERNNRIFKGQASSVEQVAFLIKDAFVCRNASWF